MFGIKCSKCGVEIKDDGKCPKCGHQVISVSGNASILIIEPNQANNRSDDAKNS